MSTKATIHVHDGEVGTPILLSIYKHCDGSPAKVGRELSRFIDTADVNGIGCLAALLVARLKNGKGGVYIHPAGTNAPYAYIYQVYAFNDGFRLRVLDRPGGKQLFDGAPAAYAEWLEAFSEAEAAQ